MSKGEPDGPWPLAERVLAALQSEGHLSAHRIAKLLSQTPGYRPVTRHEVNAVLYKRRDWFLKIDGPWWRPPGWEALPEVVILPGAPAPPSPGRIELIQPLQAEPPLPVGQSVSADQAVIAKERQQRKEAMAAAKSDDQGLAQIPGVHTGHPASTLSKAFHLWAKRQVTKYRDQDPG